MNFIRIKIHIADETIKVEIDHSKIDEINRLMLKSVDGDLDKAREALADAQSMIDDGYDALTEAYGHKAEISSAEDAINAGQKEIDSNRDQLNKADTQLTTAETIMDMGSSTYDEAKAAAADRISELRKEYDDIASSIDLEGAAKTLDDLASSISDLQAQRDELITQIENATGSDLSELKKQLADVDSRLSDLQKQYSDLSSSVSNARKRMSEIEDELEKAVKEENEIDKSIEDAQKELSEQREQLESGKSQLNNAQAELDSQKKAVSDAKSALNSGINSAESQLASGQSTLDEQKALFDDAEEYALDNANIDGLITVEMISQILYAQDFNMPAGYVDDSGIDSIVKVGDEILTVEDMKNLLLFDLDLEYIDEVRLGDVADVYYSDTGDEIYSKLNVDDGVVLMFTKQSTYSASDVSSSIKQAMADLEEEYPGLTFVSMMDEGIYIDIIINTVINNLLMGALLAVVVLFLFLRNIKPTLVVAASIPISVIFAIALMYFSGVTLNIISLAGLALGIGMLVDNSIVVIENVYRLRDSGMGAMKAALQGAKEMAPAITASTVTTVSVFLPIVFTNGLTRQLFTDMALTITYSLVASLLVALTVAPAMSSLLLVNIKQKEKKESRFGKTVANGYRHAASWALRFKPVVIIAIVAMLGISAYGAFQNGTILLPNMDSTQMLGTIVFPKDTPQEEQFDTADEISRRILELDDVESLGVIVAGNDASLSFLTGGGGENEFSLYINLYEENKRKNTEIVKDVRKITDEYDIEAAISPTNFDISTLTGVSGVQVTLQGNNYDDLMTAAKDVAVVVSSTEGTLNTDNGIGDTNNEIRIIVDKDAAVKSGLTVAQIYQTVAAKISTGYTATSMYEGGRDYPVVVVDADALKMSADELGNIKIDKIDMQANAEGMEFEFDEDALKGEEDEEDAEDQEEEETAEEDERDYVLLSEIADIERGESPSAINRNDQVRTINVQAAVDSDHNVSKVSREVEQRLADYVPPEGVTVGFTGESNAIYETIFDLFYIVGIAIVLIYLIMVIQFQSFKSPFIVMFTIPLAFTGGFLALWMNGYELSMIALLGFLLLAGVVVNNGIVLVDCINRFRLDGMDRKDAIIRAGQTRMRPILMTALTTIFGLLTMTLGMGMGADMLQPMAAVVVGGLAYATIITLFFVPVMYDIMNKKEIKRRDVDKEV